MTQTAFPTPQPLKRCAIIGTAPSWKACPWQDQTLEVWTLNDGYVMGIPRISRHYDIHPWHQMQFRPPAQPPGGSSQAMTAQIGTYVRPTEHLAWLKTRPFPVYLDQARPEAPYTRTFPKDEILAFFQPMWPWRVSRTGQIAPGPDYEVSTPSWMLMHAIAEGYGEIHIYGIHLSTEWEYLQQRPNFELLIGIALGRGIKIVLPESTPICKASYRYAYEPKADIPQQILNHQIAKTKHEGAQIASTLAGLKWYERGRRKDLETRRRTLDVELADARQELGRVSVGV